ncbi:hypothetical protein [Amycolatopsis saalfeldensis]|uniref:Uncharacterized protein n=1 Tax=Amycolatopsis saalfeldensis TaxID=394193 RepID=A0A1H8YPD4_9PSEU|nr:hypothetical protein [Amycolatopsis saalfeldensis]SEP54075.1 hypothetical protein SAMN04489732_13632 [Amycolatopsis saalfeldensis]
MNTNSHPGRLGRDFIEAHRIEVNAINLDAMIGPGITGKIWVIRMDRTARGNLAHQFTWLLEDQFDHDELDWDDVLCALSRWAWQGRQSLDSFVAGEIGHGADVAIHPSDHEWWVGSTSLWHKIRNFLAWDDSLIDDFFRILPPQRAGRVSGTTTEHS